MRVLVVTHSYGRNGAAVILKQVLGYWARELGWQVDSVILGEQRLAHGAELEALGIGLVEGSVSVGRYDFALVNTLIDLHHVEKLSRVLPVMLWVHEGITMLGNLTRGFAELLRAFSLPRLLVFQTRWQTDSAFRSFLHALPPERVAVVPCGVERPRVASSARRPAIDGVVRLLCVGSVYPRKRQMDLARAAVTLAARRRVICTFVGDLAHADAFGSTARELLHGHPDVLRWVGEVDATGVAEACVDADIACFPSGDESFGIAPLEAGLAGLPVVLADIPAYQDVGWRDGVNCLMHPVGDVGRLQSCIESLADDSRLRTRIATGANALARQYPMDRFLAQITAEVLSAFGGDAKDASVPGTPPRPVLARATPDGSPALTDGGMTNRC